MYLIFVLIVSKHQSGVSKKKKYHPASELGWFSLLEDHGLFFFLVYFLLVSLLGGDARLCTPPYRKKESRSNGKGGKTNMKGAKIGVIFLVMIMALAGVGASYATWSQSVNINGSVTTGHFDFRIGNIVVNDNGGASISVAYMDWQTWSVTVTDTYPGWKGYITVTNWNAGTVPLKFNTFQVLDLVADDWTMYNAYTLKFYPYAYGTTPNPANVYGTLYDFTTLQYYSWWLGSYEVKLMPGSTHDSLISLELDPALTGHYNSPVTFIFQLTAIQTTP